VSSGAFLLGGPLGGVDVLGVGLHCVAACAYMRVSCGSVWVEPGTPGGGGGVAVSRSSS